jgi:ABC-type branched-subunit amino acid transport system substrate-binding protein/predicted negative regulator of RcsB-dependent stress response
MLISSFREWRVFLAIASWLLSLPAIILSDGTGILHRTSALAADPAAEQGRPGNKRGVNPTLDKARNFLDADQLDAAIGVLKDFIAASPGSDVLDDVYLMLGTVLIKKQEYAEAITYLDRLLSEFPKSDLGSRARVLLGTAHAELGNLDKALPMLAEARSLSSDLETKLAALKLTGELYARKKDFPRAIQAWREEISLAPQEQQDGIRQQIRALVMEKMDKASLVRLHDTSPTEFPGDLALIRLIELHAAVGADYLAERAIHQFLRRFPNHPYSETASAQLRSLKAKLKASQYVIAAVLPLSGGRLSAFGTESLNGIRLALERGKEIFNLSSVGLLIKDSDTSKSALRSELADLIAEYRPIAVIGPLLSRDLQTVAGLATQTEAPFITPSATLSDVHRLGSYVFSTALTALPQARRLADYATKRAGYRRFCILHPETAYGQELARLFSQEVRQRGGEIIATESYKEDDTDFGVPIKRIKGADLKKYGKSMSVPTSKGSPRTIYTPGFDAIFLPGNAGQINLIAAQLVFYDVKVAFLGSNAWNSPDLLRLSGRSLEGSVFTDGFFLDSPDSQVREFVDLYRRRYQSDPSIFSVQAYDATWLVLAAIRKGGASGRAVRDLLAKGQDFPTLAGAAAFGPEGTLDRHVVLLQVKQGKLMQLD